MTEPRPRLTNKIGNVQQISVVSDDVKPIRLMIRSRMISLLRTTARHTTTHKGAGRNQISRLNG